VARRATWEVGLSAVLIAGLLTSVHADDYIWRVPATRAPDISPVGGFDVTA